MFVFVFKKASLKISPLFMVDEVVRQEDKAGVWRPGRDECRNTEIEPSLFLHASALQVCSNSNSFGW